MKIHIVKQGDSLFALSQKYGVPLQKIIEANPQIANPDVLAVGDKVKIPAAPVALPVPDNNDIYYKHTVKQGDTLWKLSKAWGITLKDMIDANPQLKNPNALMTGEVVNIPKKVSTSPIQAQSISPVKANTTPIQAQSAAPAVVDKTAIGGKTYTGVIEKASSCSSPGSSGRSGSHPNLCSCT
ncbi:LysM peptidoglycan-binding domain-containing protein [Paenibacillus rhizoplanae]